MLLPIRFFNYFTATEEVNFIPRILIQFLSFRKSNVGGSASIFLVRFIEFGSFLASNHNRFESVIEYRDYIRGGCQTARWNMFIVRKRSRERFKYLWVQRAVYFMLFFADQLVQLTN